MGKREVGQMTLLDLVLILLISNSVQNAMTGPDTSVTGGLVAALTLLIINVLVTKLIYRSKKLSKIVEGSPVMLVHSGVILEKNLEDEKISKEELLQAVREHGIADFSEIYLAVLEVDGTISVVKRDELPSSPRPHSHIRFIRRK
jgi:uncharacterized membrane protein YcaP (DUF421 family)